MRKGIIAIVTLFTLAVQTPQPARAGAFATEITQLLNHAQLIMQYLRQAEQLAEAVKQTADMLKNSKILPGQVFGPISSDLNALASIVQGGQALSYSLANLDSQFQGKIPRLRLHRHGLLHAVSKLVTDFLGYYPRSASRGWASRPTASE